MKTSRVFMIACLLAAAIFSLSGCATDNRRQTEDGRDHYGMRQEAPSPTENMNLMEKSGYYLGWFILRSIYATAAANPQF